MAEDTEIVIFPKIRCSELEKDVENKKRALDQSTTALTDHVKKKTKPLVLIKEHPKLLLGTAFTLFSSTKVLGKFGSTLFSLKKNKFLWKILKAGWVWRLIKMGIQSIVKKKLQ